MAVGCYWRERCCHHFESSFANGRRRRKHEGNCHGLPLPLENPKHVGRMYEYSKESI